MSDQAGKPPPQGLSRSERILAAAAAVLALCLIGVLLGFANVARLHDSVLSEIENTRATRRAVYEFMQASIDAETGQRGYLLTGDPEFLQPYEEGRSAALGRLTRLREITAANASLHASVERANALATRAFEQLEHPLDERRFGRLDSASLRAELSESKVTMDALRAEVQVLLRESEALLESRRAIEADNTARLYWLGGAMALITMMGLGMTFWALYSERKSWRSAFVALEDARAAAEEARERAAASDLAKTRFLAVASHDMRQPLHALTLYLSALERRVENEEARGIIAKMERATDSMITMFSTLLDLARIQGGVVNPEVEAFPLQDVFDRIAAEHADGSLDVEPTTLTLYSDPTLIERALRNLVTNAMKHGGGKARLSARKAGDRAEVVVADDGPGISPEDQKRIFDEFVRIDKRGAGDGLGLGLAIVKGIGRALSMPVDVQSTPGHGAWFILRPRLSPIDVVNARGEGRPESLDGIDTLVVDDEELAREAVAGALGDMGARVRTAANETEALALLAGGFAPRLIIMDLRIDGELIGVGIGKRLAERVTPAPRVIVVTGDTAADTLEMLRESGFPWLIKPVNPAELSRLAAAERSMSLSAPSD
jgi:signal transduction histidine kinase/CheY-like chemotaxis protein